MTISPYDQLVQLGKETQLVADAQALLGWDQEVLLPRSGVPYRAEQMAWFSGWLHNKFTAEEVGDWISAAEVQGGSSEEIANLREWRHSYDRETKLPESLVREFAETQVRAKSTWAEARAKDDFSLFAPSLTRLIEICREQAERWGYDGHLYDALIDKFERGGTTKMLTSTLGALRSDLIPVVEEAVAKPLPDISKFRGHYPVADQERFNAEVAASIGFDFSAGRIDTAVHPFCSGMAPFDTRLTTRYDESDFCSSLFGVLHETGHGLYEQGLKKELRGQPVGNSASLGVHESQSRLWENHVGRSRGFWNKWLPVAAGYFPNLKSVTLDEMVAYVNRTELSHIRVEADEVTYDLHILLRFEIEKDLFSGDLKVADIPGEWNTRFEKYFGLPVTKDSEGCLQDIHWSMGIFGYFPTYSLGNINAAHLAAAAVRQDPSLNEAMDKGDYSGLLTWMRTNIHGKGSLYLPSDLIAEAAGAPADASALIEHLKSRYL